MLGKTLRFVGAALAAWWLLAVIPYRGWQWWGGAERWRAFVTDLPSVPTMGFVLVTGLFALGSITAGLATVSPSTFGYASRGRAVLAGFGLAVAAFPAGLVAAAALAALGFKT